MGSFFLPLRRKEFRTSRPKKDERKAVWGKKIAGKGENPFEKGLFPFPRTPIPFPKTFIITSAFPVLRAHERQSLPPRRLPDAHAIAKLKLHSIALCPPHPVCTRHAVRPASLAQRRLRLTPEVNSGCLPPLARPTFSFFRVPQLPVCAGHTVQAAGLARRALRLTAGVNPAYLCPTFSFSEYRHVPFAQDTLYGLRNLHDGGCV